MRRNAPGECFPGSSMTPDEVEFALAMERYMRRTKNRFPRWSQVLEVARSLGYCKRKPLRNPFEKEPGLV